MALSRYLTLFATALPAVLCAQTVVVPVVAIDYSLETRNNVPAGLVTFQLTNRGSSDHELVIERLPEGVSIEDFVHDLNANLARRYDYPGVGGPAAPPDTARRTSVTVELEQGRYFIGCFHTTAGRTHFARGMYRQLVALPIRTHGAPPITDAIVDLNGVTSGAGRGVVVQRTVRAGLRVFEVRNRGASEADLLIGRLKAGRTAADVERWQVDGKGVRPYDSFGGVTALGSGRSAHLALRLEKGDYALIVTQRGGGRTVRPITAN